MSLILFYESLLEKYPILTKDEEFFLVGIAQDKEGIYSEDERRLARDRLVACNIRFVMKQSKKMSLSLQESDLEDLIEDGIMGLINAVDKYDPESGNRFLTYAGWWVFHSHMNYMAKRRMVFIPKYKQQILAKLCKMRSKIGRELTDQELKDLFPRESEESVKEMASTQYPSISLEELEENNESVNHSTDETYAESYDVMSMCNGVDSGSELLETCLSLRRPYGEILIHHFGLYDGIPKPMSEIADTLNMSRASLSEKKKQALRMMKDLLD